MAIALDWTAEVPEDEPFLVRLYTSVREDEVRSFGWDEAQMQAFLEMQFRMQRQSYRLQYPAAEYRIIRMGGEPVGRLIIASLPDAVVLVDISLLPAYRKMGIGTRLLSALKQEAAGGGKPVRLQVMHTNPAKRLYERLGFHTTGRNELYAAMEWQPVIR
ncbi:GNAT family N-acetyltransferase [Paenibacillus filicis]|uniref:GNAT family N-acetyltransferase n=1 Tax=Paenibacillus gyeongsangnamensis TaxID=3388067 RepID=A0ABT4Q8S5_9BACL|nr:GNAT family N-acetyltransferase [Paenibacillus filicis]MCZ8513238.1 GNAT family N-acetyltransferase [Paenibacillus filicis]